jgi:hypothetical protein
MRFVSARAGVRTGPERAYIKVKAAAFNVAVEILSII